MYVTLDDKRKVGLQVKSFFTTVEESWNKYS